MKHKIYVLKLCGCILIPILACIFLFAGDNRLRPLAKDYTRITTHAIAGTTTTPIGNSLQNAIKAHPGLSGFHLVTNGHAALMLRLDMIEAATRSLDLQYYSIQDDITGRLLLAALLHAAERGVRIRMLIDDITIKKSDPVWKIFVANPHIEIRLFNPLATYSQSLFGRIKDIWFGLNRFDRRMHNKLFIADNQLSIIGGRNLGDAYFDNNRDLDFHDVDVLAAGPVTQQASDIFDSYWNSSEAYPIASLIPMEIPASRARTLQADLTRHWQEELTKGDIAIDPPLSEQLQNGTLPLVWANSILAADTPDKLDLPKSTGQSKPATAIDALMRGTKHEFIAIASYFVPSTEEIDWMKNLHLRNVSVRILTNSLGSTDVAAVSVGYSHIRTEVIANGAELYELKPIPGRFPRSGRFSSASRASLHSKIYVIDKSDIVVGTYNSDPRSTLLNTEIDIVIHSPEMAEQLVKLFDHIVSPAYSFHVVLKNKDSRTRHLEWITEEHGKLTSYDNEPGVGFWRSIEAKLLYVVPWGNQL